MTEPTYLAIDAPTTRDVDDAIALTRESDGSWLARVLIANAAAFVPIGSTEDAFARNQGATIYMGQKAVQPMLPRSVAEHDAALQAGKVRPAMKVKLRITPEFDVSIEELTFCRKKIFAHVPYSTIAERARNPEDPLQPLLLEMIAVSQGLLASRRNRGALAFYDLTRLLFLDEEGRMRQAQSKDDAIGQILVQEFMILANAAIATWAVEHDVPVLFRNHHARSAAPAAPDLAKTIQGWLSGSALNELAAREQLDLILGVATYGASLTGHFALNLGAYCHGTSPIRRYADLVNQRQLFAAVAGEPLPYTKDDLETIALEVNDTLAQRKQERKDGFKATMVRRASLALQNHRFDTLADHELSQALKLARESNDYPPALVATLTQRIRQGVLTDQVYDRLLEAPGASLPGELTAAWADLLAQTPHRSGHLIYYGLQTGLFVDYRTNPQRANADTGSFTDNATIQRVADGQVLAAQGRSARKQDAANIAAARLIMAHLGAAIPAQVRPADAADAPTANHKGRLQERCQKQRWPLPRYDVTMEGPTNAAKFHCTATLQLPGRPLSVTARDERTRIGAEHAAAAALIAKLHHHDAAPAPTPTSPAQGNPIGWLQERAQKAGHALPAYDIAPQGDAFACTLRVVEVPDRTFQAVAPAKADAKRQAAAAAVSFLQRS